MRLVGGIFVGGASRRMGGRPKGLLPHPRGGTLVDRLALALTEVGAEVVLVGAGAAYDKCPWPRVLDAPAGVGPLGGLCGLLERAEGGAAIAVACDMPGIDERSLRRLIEAKGDHLAVAPMRGGRFEPLCAIYDARALTIARRRATEGALALQGLLRALEAATITLDDVQLDDWDSPEDVKDA